MGFISNFFKGSENSSDVAKNRLRLAITSDRAVCSPEVMEQLKMEIVAVISKYLNIDREGLDIKLTKTELEDSSETVNVLLANIPIREDSSNFRKRS
ncbi:MAG: cell division topological specificity factor MinE [Lachnospiraceae bacterium]|nr:cell division topological specificity factor MinE [Lachnospiraceae bacterium]